MVWYGMAWDGLSSLPVGPGPTNCSSSIVKRDDKSSPMQVERSSPAHVGLTKELKHHCLGGLGRCGWADIGPTGKRAASPMDAVRWGITGRTLHTAVHWFWWVRLSQPSWMC